MTRRDFLLTLGGAVVALAGCVGTDTTGGQSDDSTSDQSDDTSDHDENDAGDDDSRSDEDENDGHDSEEGSGDDDGRTDEERCGKLDTGDPKIEDASLETTDASSGTRRDGRAAAEIEDTTVTVTGSLSAPNPCHEAVLGSYSISGDVLEITIDLESTLGPGEMCTDVIGVIQYEASFEGENLDALDDVEVDHVDPFGD